MSERTPSTVHGRGTGMNPQNRFAAEELVLDPEVFDAARTASESDDELIPIAPATRFYRDATKNILATNDSPDIGFDFSVNPYRGCEHGCVYCMSGETRILMSDGSTRPLAEVRVGDHLYGTVRRGAYRRYAATQVLAHWSTRKPAYRVTLAGGIELVASGDHRFLTRRGWKHVTGNQQGRDQRPHLTTNDVLLGIGRIDFAPPAGPDYQRGYLSGMIRGDALLASYSYSGRRRRTDDQHHFRLAWVDEEGLTSPAPDALRVVSIEPLPGERELFDITTGTGDFVAEGVISHNCYARPTHEYLGFSAGLDFETRIMVKENAPALLREALMKPSWKPQMIMMSGVTDCYQPIERQLRLTRGCLEVLRDFRNPVGIVTKSALVARDADVLAELAQFDAARVAVSVTSLDEKLASLMEPRAARPNKRLETIAKLAAAKVPVHVMIGPVVPGLTDHEIPAILKAAKEAGATGSGMVVMRLPHGVKELFFRWLADHFPDRVNRVLHRVQSIRGGKLSDARFGTRQTGEGIFATEIEELYRIGRARAGFTDDERTTLSAASFRRPGPKQGTLFGA